MSEIQGFLSQTELRPSLSLTRSPLSRSWLLPFLPYLSFAGFILLPGELLHAIYYGLYVHTCTESKAQVFGTTSTFVGTYLRSRERRDVRHISRKDLPGMTSPAAYSFVLDTATPTERQMARWTNGYTNSHTVDYFRDSYQRARDKWRDNFENRGTVNPRIWRASRGMYVHECSSVNDSRALDWIDLRVTFRRKYPAINEKCFNGGTDNEYLEDTCGGFRWIRKKTRGDI